MAFLEPPSRAVGGQALLGVPVKQVFLVALTFQSSILILVTHYSRVMPQQGTRRYFTSTAVFLSEVIKLAVSLTVVIYEQSRTLAPQTPITILFEQIYNSVFRGDGWKLAIPAALYTLENTLQYFALGNLDAVHFQILFQLKILTTAIFSVTLLGRSLGARRWLSIFLLTAGVCIVCLRTNTADQPIVIHDMSDHFFERSKHEMGAVAEGLSNAARQFVRRAMDETADITDAVLHKRSASYEGIKTDLGLERTPMDYSMGVIAVLVAAAISGLTGVYFEKVLKDSPTPVSVSMRNVQLSFYSLIAALLFGIVLKDGSDIMQYGFFVGYNAVVWTAIVSQAAGGLLTSLCINYADNIAKNFATSISIIVSFVFSVWFFRFEVSPVFIIGTAMVLGATFMYSLGERSRSRPPPINIVEYEKTVISNTPRNLSYTNLNMNPMDSATLGLSTSRPSTPMRHHARVPSARRDHTE